MWVVVHRRIDQSMESAMTTQQKINAVINDKSASDLLRFIVSKYDSRDPCDAAADLEYAAKLFADKAAGK